MLAVQSPESSTVLLTNPAAIDITSAPAPAKGTEQKKPFGVFDEIVDQVFRTVVAANAGALLKNAAQLQAAETKKQLIRRLLQGDELKELDLPQDQLGNAYLMIDIQGGKIVVNPAMLRLLTEYLATQAAKAAA